MKKKGNIYIKNIAQVVSCRGKTAKKGREAMNELGVLEGPAAIIAKEGVTKYVGPMSDGCEEDTKDCTVLDASGACVLPGFVDSHTHLVFGGFREEEFQWRLAGDSYMSIMERGGGIASTMKATRLASPKELYDAAYEHLNAQMRMGVTSVEAKSGYGMEHDTELKQLEVMKQLNEEHPLDIYSTFMGAHDIPPKFKGRNMDFIHYLIDEVMPDVKAQKLARACDIFTEKGVFDHEETRTLLNAAKEMGFSVKMHADEIVPFGGAELAAELGCLSADHLLRISDKGIQALAESDTVATVLPCTAFSLKAEYAPARKMIDAGCAVAMASDLNPGSCFSSSVPLMIALATIYMNMSVEEAITALTINGAAAIGAAEEIGSIEPGKQADYAIIRYPSYKFLSYHFGMNLVQETIKRGVSVYQLNTK